MASSKDGSQSLHSVNTFGLVDARRRQRRWIDDCQDDKDYKSYKGQEGRDARDHRELSLQGGADRYDRDRVKFVRKDRYGNLMRRSRSASTDEDIPPRRHRSTIPPVRYNLRNAQIMGRISKDPYGLTIRQKFNEHGEPEGEREILLRRMEALERRQGKRT
ncbi:hypothetical protein LWI29_018737 [Acer saccharum]|uniref:Uncharacterized protein n=1 Tax=Acer saccharum TaxID=4024 RepID=A0AA39VBX8_ACESA|nr:hypothetical protein LWI29_018737 [Acer saccharum]